MSLKSQLETITQSWVQAKNEQFAGHPIARLIRQELANEIQDIVRISNDKYLIEGSPGAGNWASVPWLAVFDPKITTSATSGIYPVYLFRADGTGIYLSLGFGSSHLVRAHGRTQAGKEAEKVRQRLRNTFPKLRDWNEEIDTRSTTGLGKSYEWATAGAKFYPSESIPEENELQSDLSELLEIYKEIVDADEIFDNVVNRDAMDLRISKPFLLLAGISGTGKTRFVREQAKASGNLRSTYCLTAVRPDWHEPSDLLGYISRLNGDPEYICTDVLLFIVAAWRSIADTDISISAPDANGQALGISITGNDTQLQAIPPYWLCLDEMNLAPIEQYFADYLSVLETRQWDWEDDKFQYSSDPILKALTINQVTNLSEFRSSLGLADSAYDGLWSHFCQHGIGIPFNLIVAGTVNMDETTHGFSRKVIDRALTFDFGEFFPNDFDEYFSPTTRNKAFNYPIWSEAALAFLPTIDSDGKKSIAFLSAVNNVLGQTSFRLAFRALNELLLTVISHKPQNDIELRSVWDDFLMCKVLPRIEGDSDKLATNDAGTSILQELEKLLRHEFAQFWPLDDVSTLERPDLCRERIDSDKEILIECRSRRKIQWMQDRLKRSGFTSFWP